MYCKNCGKLVDDNAFVCLSCGAKIERSSVSTDAEGAKSKIAAGVLGILLGGLGIHRFYLGYIGIGIVQIVVTCITFGVGSLWGFIEGILILTGSILQRDAKGNPLRNG